MTFSVLVIDLNGTSKLRPANDCFLYCDISLFASDELCAVSVAAALEEAASDSAIALDSSLDSATALDSCCQR